MDPIDQEPRAADLREYLHVLRSRKWSIVLVTAAVVALVLVFSFRQTPVYEGTARVLVRPFSTASTPAPATVDLVTEQQLITTPVVAARAAKILHGNRSPESLLSGLHVEIVSTSQILSISYDDPSPTVAARTANAFATGYIQYRRGQFLEQIRAAGADLNRRISATQTDLAGIEKKILGCPS